MPELPEVETIRRDLAAALTGRRFLSVDILSPKMVWPRTTFFKRELAARRILGVDRRGKLLIFRLSPLKKSTRVNKKNKAVAFDYLLIHLKMTGQLIYQSKKLVVAGGHSLAKSSNISRDLPNKYTRAIFYFKAGGRLFFNDLRKFGYLKLSSKLELDNLIARNYGPEPLTPAFTVSALQRIFKNKKIKIKAALLDQKLIAGLGNIYVDESLFAARILPTRLASSLTASEIKKLWQSIQRIIRLAIINRGTTFSDYRDSAGRSGNFSRYLKVYGRTKEKCSHCGHAILKVKLAGRGTHYCAHCQK
ncbi:MAG: bifunctional DNA-formamidopyrimidine glycosylase/DNA-(apurinic or apyrimidinic site) lyase [Patescibacteria group bacterium]